MPRETLCILHYLITQVPIRNILQGVPQYWIHFVFSYFVGFYSTKIQKLGELYKIQEICYQIGTRILKIDLEIAEIIHVEDGTHHLEIDILLLLRRKKNFGVVGGNFDVNYLS